MRKKNYIIPNIEIIHINQKYNLLCGSLQYVDPGDGNKEPIKKDDSDDGWAASKENNYFDIWENE